MKFFEVILESSKNAAGKLSSARISSYYILASILLCGLAFFGIEIGNACLSWSKSEAYIVPPNHIVIFTLILSHHLILLGLKKSSESTSTTTNLMGTIQTNIPDSSTATTITNTSNINNTGVGTDTPPDISEEEIK